MEETNNHLEAVFSSNMKNINNNQISSENEEKQRIFTITKMTKEKMFNSKFLQSFLKKNINFSEVKEENKKIDLPDFNFEGLISALINIKSSNSVSEFHSNFMDFKTVLNFHRPLRKTKIDSILKKCKSKFFRAVQDSIKKITNDLTQVNRLPQSFITNINIDYNKNYMNKTIFEIYRSLNLVNQEKEFFIGISDENIPKLKSLLNYTYSQLFNIYTESQRFKEDCEVIREKEGEKFEILYKYVSKIYINYYSLSKGNRPKKIYQNNNKNGKNNYKKNLFFTNRK
jgi:hypothetical protein